MFRLILLLSFSAGGRRADRKLSVQRKRRSRWLALEEGLLYLGPALILFLIFTFYPLFKSVRLSLYETNLLGVEKFYVGLEQYVNIFKEGNFGHNLWVTLLFTAYTVIPGMILALGLAYIANWQLKGIGLFRTIFASPLVIAVASTSLIWQMLYTPTSGVLNYMLHQLGLPGVNWLADPRWALLSVSAVSVWHKLGFHTVLILSAMQNIPEHLYDSAKVDGAGRWRTFKDITLPMLSPTLFFVLITSVINTLQTFGEINILTHGGPAGATNVVVYSIYREAFFNMHFSFASAEAMVLFVIILAITLFQFWVLERKVFYR